MHFPFQSATSVSLESAILEQDYQNARHIENAALGQQCFYYPAMFRLRYLPYEQLQWAYLRAEENHVTMCCGKGYIDIWYLILYADGRQTAKIEFQKKESAKEVFTSLTEKNPQMLAGFTKENKERYAAIAEH